MEVRPPPARSSGARREGSLRGPLCSVSAAQHHRLLASHIAPWQSIASSRLETCHRFPLQTSLLCLRKGGILSSHVRVEKGTRPSAATWEPAATQDARAAVSSATKITSRLSTYFRTFPSCRATRPNYSRLLLYLLVDAAGVCPAYCTFPCKGLPHSPLRSELSSGSLPHTC